jgi:hypothetical protein
MVKRILTKRKLRVKEGSKFFNEEILFQEILTDIRFWKNQQWLIITYVFGIYAALVSFVNGLQKLIDGRNISFLNLTVIIIGGFLIPVVMIIGSIILCRYSKDIYDSREFKGKIINRHPNLREILGYQEKKKYRPDRISNLLICLIILGGFAISVYLILFVLKGC